MRRWDRVVGLPVLGRTARALARLAARIARHATAPGASPPPFPLIVGVARSGTTLLRMMLDAHSELAIPPETGWLAEIAETPDPVAVDRETMLRHIRGVVQWADFHVDPSALAVAFARAAPFTRTEGVRAFYRLYAARFGKSRAGDKTPGYLLHMEAIERLLPEAHFIHILRDGRDVALSVRSLWFASGRTMEELAHDWCRRVRAGREQGARCRRYLEVRFEDLVRDPVSELLRVCAFVDLPYEAGMERYYHRSAERLQEHEEQRDREGRLVVTKDERLRNQRRVLEPPETSRVEAWRREMSEEERRAFERVAGPTLRELGYETTEG